MTSSAREVSTPRTRDMICCDRASRTASRTLTRSSPTASARARIASRAARTPGGVRKGVFRPQACSRCRFRTTGPAFLNGLVLRLNALMVEITSSFELDRSLADEVSILEEAGRSASRIEARIRRHRRFRDELWAEWAAELATIRRIEGAMDEGGPGDGLPVEPGALATRFDEVHPLILMHDVVMSGSGTAGGSMEVPAGTREMRDEMLLEIARRNDAAEFFYRLDPERRRAACDAFGEMITRHAADRVDQDPSFVERLLSGEIEMPELSDLTDGSAGADVARADGRRPPPQLGIVDG